MRQGGIEGGGSEERREQGEGEGVRGDGGGSEEWSGKREGRE